MDGNPNIIGNLADNLISHNKSTEDLIIKHEFTFILAIVGLIFKASIEKFIASLFVFFGNDYNEDDIVYINNKPGRIVRMGYTKTVFFIYDIVDGKIVGGYKLVVQNDKLSEMNIEKPLPELNLTKFHPDSSNK